MGGHSAMTSLSSVGHLVVCCWWRWGGWAICDDITVECWSPRRWLLLVVEVGSVGGHSARTSLLSVGHLVVGWWWRWGGVDGHSAMTSLLSVGHLVVGWWWRWGGVDGHSAMTSD